MRLSLFAFALAILGCSLLDAQQTAQAQETPQTPPTGAQQVQLTQEHLQILQQIVQQMPQEQREQLAQLPREQQQQVLLHLLARVLQPKRAEIKEWLQEDQDKSVIFEEAERYPDATERIENFIHKETKRRVEVVSVAYLREGHDHFLNYKRLYRAKYTTPKDGKEYVADFLFEKEGAYLKLKEWRRVPEEQQASRS